MSLNRFRMRWFNGHHMLISNVCRQGAIQRVLSVAPIRSVKLVSGDIQRV